MSPGEPRSRAGADLVQLSVASLWDQVFTVAPLVIVGTKEGEGYDLAPKHLAMPLGWGDLYGFVCTPRHATYRNVLRHPEFTVSFPSSEEIVRVSLAAGGRSEDGSKPGLAALETFPATNVDGVLAAGCSLYLECELERVIDGLGENVLVVGRVLAAAAPSQAVRGPEVDDADVVYELGPVVYLAPGRFARVRTSLSFPFPVDFRR